MAEEESSWTICFHLLSSVIFTIGLIYAPADNVNIYYVGFLGGAVAMYGFDELCVKIKRWVKIRNLARRDVHGP